MKRPLFVIGITFAAATWLAFFFSSSTALLLSAACALTGIAALLLRKTRMWYSLGAVCLTAALALGCYSLYLARVVEPFRSVEEQQVELQGIILSASGSGRSSTYTLRCQFLSHPALPEEQIVKLKTFGEIDAAPGDTIRCLAQVQLPEDTAYRYYQANSIQLLGTLQGVPHLVEESASPTRQSLLRLRTRMQQNLSRSLPPEHAAVTEAMVLGLRDNLPPELSTDLSRAGSAHLLAVSGLHLSILTACLLRFLQKLRIPSRLASLLAIFAALVFAALTGFSASVLRAFVMTSLTLLGHCLSRRADPLTSLGTALLIICLIRPSWILHYGLWLSASSTLGILLFLPAWIPKITRLSSQYPKPIRRFVTVCLEAGATTICAYSFSFPILFLTNGWVSLVAPFTSILIAPFLIFLIPGGMLCAVGAGSIIPAIASITDFCAGMVVSISRILAGVPFAVFALDEGWLLLFLCLMVFCIGCLFYLRADRQLILYTVLLLLVSFSAGSLSYSFSMRNSVEFVTLEGCDTAILLRGDTAVLIGTPNRYNTSLLSRYLDFRGVTHISAVIAPDYPASGIDSGILRLEEQFGMDCMVTPDDAYILDTLAQALPAVAVLPSGYAMTAVLDGVQIETQPDRSEIFLQAGGHCLLKTGEEYAIITEYESMIRIGRDGRLWLPAGVHPQVEPLGRRLFGETRLILPLSAT